MATLNKSRTRGPAPKTHGGAPAVRTSKLESLERSVMACLLWEDTFYEDGISIADRITTGVANASLTEAADIAIAAREQQHLRHVPLLVVREMARRGGQRDSHIIGETLTRVIQRPDELTEFLAIYWKDNPDAPLSSQVKKGLAGAFDKFDEYQLAKYNRTGKAVTLRDVMFLTHPKPRHGRGDMYKRLANGELKTPDTWEVALSSRGNTKAEWERLLEEDRLGGLALLRNLRNMQQAGVKDTLVKDALINGNYRRVLPFRFVAAAKSAPRYEYAIDQAFLGTLSQAPKIPGKTVVVIDVSGSMYGGSVSRNSDMDRAHAACALGAVLREVCEDVVVYATAGSDAHRRHKTQIVPARRGIGLVDSIYNMCGPLGGGGIFLNQVCEFLAAQENDVDHMIVITDEQDCAGANDAPSKAVPLGKVSNYLLNVNTYKNGIGYGPKWTHINGWSESVVKYITQVERG